MKKTLTLMMLTVFTLAAPAIASDLPSHYPDEGFSRTGRVDAVFPSEGRVVIDDIPYPVAKAAIVHSLTINSVSMARIRPGVLVAFRMGGNREIEEFWLLPTNYRGPGQR